MNCALRAEISEWWLQVWRDPTVDALLANAAAKIVAIDVPFEPDAGAYSHATPEGSTHDHSCPHSEQHHHDY